MHSQNRHLKTWIGSFEKLKLDYSPEPPLSSNEHSRLSENYPTELAYLHIYLDGNDAAIGLPPTYLLLLLDHLLAQFGDIMNGNRVMAEWFSDPWRLELKGRPSQNRILITLQVPNRWVAIQEACVPLDQFGKELLSLARNWGRYLEEIYPNEIADPDWGKQYRRFVAYLEDAQPLFEEYETG